MWPGWEENPPTQPSTRLAHVASPRVPPSLMFSRKQETRALDSCPLSRPWGRSAGSQVAREEDLLKTQ